MLYYFHDIKNIVGPYLEGLLTHSARQWDYLDHLRVIFLQCCHYNIRLSPHIYIFCVDTGRLLGFIVLKDGIQIDSLKVQAILDFPSPSNLLQLQIL